MQALPTSASAIIELKINGQHFSVLTLHGTESLYQPFHLAITLLLYPFAWSASWLLKSAQLCLPERVIAGVITHELVEVVQQDHLLRLTITLAPRFSLLKLNKTAQMFVQQSVISVIKQYLLAVGYVESQLRFSLQSDYPSEKYLLQIPDETDADFIQRLASHAGLFFWFGSGDHNQEIMMFSDNNAAFNRVPLSEPYNALQLSAVVPDQFIFKDYNEGTPETAIFGSAGNSRSLYLQQRFGFGAKDSEAAEKLSRYCYEAKQVRAEQWMIESSASQLRPGSYFSMADGDYLVISITHYVQQPAGIHGEGQSVHYYNKIEAIPAAQPFRWLPKPFPALPALLVGHIESQSEYAELDTEGRYTSRLHLDLSNRPYTQAMPLLRRVTSYASGIGVNGNNGLHFPLRDQAEILISFLYGNPNRPVIVGSLYNAKQVSPVTSDNPQQSIFRTQGANEMIMDDSPLNRGITIQNPNAVNILQLNAMPEAKLTLQSQGELYLHAGNQISYTIAQDYQEFSQQLNQSVAQNYNNVTRQGNLYFNVQASQSFTASKNIFITAQQAMCLQAEAQCMLQAGEVLQMVVNGQQLALSVNAGTIAINSSNEIHIIGNGKGTILINQGNSSIEITKDGTINFNAPQITVIGQPIFSVQPTPPSSSALNTNKYYNQHFILQNIQTSEPLTNTTYKLTTNNEIFRGVSDDDGRTTILNGVAPYAIHLEVLE